MKYKKMIKELNSGKVISRELWTNGKTITLNKDDKNLLDVGKIGELSYYDKKIKQLEDFNAFILALPEDSRHDFKVHNTQIHTVELCTLESQDDGIDDWFIV
jgi:hypothetical protein